MINISPTCFKQTRNNRLTTKSGTKQVCAQRRPSAVNAALPAFAAERRAAIDRYLPPAGPTAANPDVAFTVDD